jgi:hypothetical protein
VLIPIFCLYFLCFSWHTLSIAAGSATDLHHPHRITFLYIKAGRKSGHWCVHVTDFILRRTILIQHSGSHSDIQRYDASRLLSLSRLGRRLSPIARSRPLLSFTPPMAAAARATPPPLSLPPLALTTTPYVHHVRCCLCLRLLQMVAMVT